MKKQVLLQLIQKPTRRMRILGLAGLLIVGVSVFAYYLGVVSPSFAKAFNGIGEGSAARPYQITNCDQLQQLNNHKNGNFVLMSDVDCSATTTWNEGKGFEPIADFAGNIDGRGYAIWDLFINRPNESNVGLLGHVPGGSATIRNLSFIKSPEYADRVDIEGGRSVGALAASFSGAMISNVHSALNVRTRGLTDNGYDGYGSAGGLVGDLRGVIEHSSSSGRVSVFNNDGQGRSLKIGGLVGFLTDGDVTNRELRVSDSLATGDVSLVDQGGDPYGQCGGLIGAIDTGSVGTRLITRTSYSSGEVDCSGAPADKHNVGGLIGNIFQGDASQEPILVEFNFTTSKTTVQTEAGPGPGFGLYGGYGRGGQTALDFVDFSSNAVDAYSTGAVFESPNLCGDNFGADEQVPACQIVNEDNADPDFYTQNEPLALFTNWNQQDQWELGSGYPEQKNWTVRTSAPTNVSAERDGDAFTVRWSHPLPDGIRTQDISDYQILITNKGTSNNGDEITLVADDQDNLYSFSAAENGLQVPGVYTIEIRAQYLMGGTTNTYEGGLYSEVINFATGMPENAPTNVQVESDAKRATVRWDRTEGATAYTLEYRAVGAGVWSTVLSNKFSTGIPAEYQAATTFEATILELNPQQSYEVRVRALNVAGSGPWSDTVAFTTPTQQQYSISTCQQLQDINQDLVGYYTLAQDIDCDNFEFTPIGKLTGQESSPFMGDFDGQGHTIKNLAIITELQQNSPTFDFDAVGLFSFTYRANLQNVTLTDSAIIANYQLDESVDSDQNGLPDAPVINPGDIEIPDNLPNSLDEVQTDIKGVIVSTQDVVDTVSPNFAVESYGHMAKVATGGVVGFVIGQGQYDNIRTVNTTVRGGLAGGVFGLILPLRFTSEMLDIANASTGEAMTIDNIHSDGLVFGHMSGGLVGLVGTPIGNALGQPTTLTIQNSSSSSEVQGSVAGGLIGLGVNTSAFNALVTLMKSEDLGFEDLTLRTAIRDSIQYMVDTQTLIIRSSQSSGLVSACESLSGLRLAALGGLVGVGAGMLVDSSVSSSPVRNCSQTTSNWGMYGGASGGVGAVMVASRIINTTASGSIESIQNDAVEQTSLLNSYIGINGGIVGVMVSASTEPNGQYSLDGNTSSGAIMAESKTGFIGISGGSVGLFVGNGTINKTSSSSNITHRLSDSFVGGLSFAGGLTGASVSFDTWHALNTYLVAESTQPVSQGLVIADSHASGNVTVQRDNRGGHVAVGGGLSGLMFGQAAIRNSYADGNVTGGLPDKVALAADFSVPEGPGRNSEIFDNSNFQAGAAVSGGLVGATFGFDVSRFGSLLYAGLTGSPLAEVDGPGIDIQGSHATGDVKGNLAGGLVGSADMKTSISKSYADGDVSGAIVGGLVGQAGFMQELVAITGSTIFGVGVMGNANPQTPEEQEALFLVSGYLDKAMRSVGPVRIVNTYATGKVTAVPGVAEAVIKTPVGIDAPINSVRLPATAGGLVGMFISQGGEIGSSYASGDVTVQADQPVVDRGAKDSEGLAVDVAKIPSIAGGLVGINIAWPFHSMEAIARDSYGSRSESLTSFAYYTSDPQSIHDSFSASSMKVHSQTLTGGSIGVFISPVHVADVFMTGGATTPEDTAKAYSVSNVYLDKTKINVTGCSGLNKTGYSVLKQIFIDTTLKDNQGVDWPSAPSEDDPQELVSIKEILKTEEGERELLSAPAPLSIARGGDPEAQSTLKEVIDAVNDAVSPTTACQYVNDANSQPNYFKANKTNAPMNGWNFSNVWVTRKDDYPKFVAGAETNEPSDPGSPTTPTTPTNPTNPSGGSTSTTTPTLNQYGRELVATPVRNIVKKLGIVGGEPQVRGLKAILASIPVFVAQSVPYSLLLLLLLLAAFYAVQASKEYKQLRVYHASMSKLVNTKESIDSYLAVTTHYLNTPVAIMNGAVELMTSLKKLTPAKAESLTGKIKRFSDAAAALLVANQVSNAQTSREERLAQPAQTNPFRAKAVMVPAGIALGLLVLANVLFIYADVFSRSPFRIVVEFGLYLLGIFLIGLAYRYRNFMSDTKELTKRQLALEADLYKKREEFIPQAQAVIEEHYNSLRIASDSLQKLPEAKLFFNGLKMLGGINDGLNNIKRFSKISDDVPLFDVTTYVRKSVRELSAVSKERKIRFETRISPGIIARIQAGEIKQLVDSLLDNAIKFTKDGGQIQVVLLKRFNKIVLSVTDNGVGISEEKLPSLLKPFTRGTESMQYNYEGIGLGLYTDRIITDKLGGTIAIHSKLGGGTSVTITLPAQREAAALLPTTIMPEVAKS